MEMPQPDKFVDAVRRYRYPVDASSWYNPNFSKKTYRSSDGKAGKVTRVVSAPAMATAPSSFLNFVALYFLPPLRIHDKHIIITLIITK